MYNPSVRHNGLETMDSIELRRKPRRPLRFPLSSRDFRRRRWRRRRRWSLAGIVVVAVLFSVLAYGVRGNPVGVWLREFGDFGADGVERHHHDDWWTLIKQSAKSKLNSTKTKELFFFFCGELEKLMREIEKMRNLKGREFGIWDEKIEKSGRWRAGNGR